MKKELKITLYRRFISICFLLFLIGFSSNKLHAQNISENASENCSRLLESTDIIYGSDIKLLSGEMYMSAHSNAEGFPFLLQEEFIKGNLLIQGERYRDVLIKYDLVADRLILNHKTLEGESVTLFLNTAFIDSFYLGRLKFVNTGKLLGKDTLKNFMEIIYDNDFKLLSSHHKSFINTYNNLTPFGSFSDANTAYFILQNNHLSEINNKRDLFRYFESGKKEIKKFLRENDIKFKKASRNELKQLMRFCDGLIEES